MGFGLPVLLTGLRRSVSARRRANGRYAGELRLAEEAPVVSLERHRTDGVHARAEHSSLLGPGRRYLVTGCAGFIGSHLTQALTRRGCSVIGVDAFTDNYSRCVKERNLAQCCADGDVHFAELDLVDEPIEALIEGVDGIFHLAGRPGVRDSWGPTFTNYLHENLLVTQRVFEAAVKQGIRVVFASSSSVYGDAEAYPLREDAKPMPVSPYGVSKLACEQLASAYGRSVGLDSVGMRYFSVYGPRQRPDMAFAIVFDCLARNRPFRLLGSGRQTRDFTYVGDVVEATLAAMRSGTAGGVYNIGGGSEISLLDSLAMCERIVGRRLDVRHVPAATGDARRTIADFGRAAAELGWAPAKSLEEGLTAQAENSAVAEAEAEAEPVAWAQPA